MSGAILADGWASWLTKETPLPGRTWEETRQRAYWLMNKLTADARVQEVRLRGGNAAAAASAPPPHSGWVDADGDGGPRRQLSLPTDGASVAGPPAVGVSEAGARSSYERWTTQEKAVL